MKPGDWNHAPRAALCRSHGEIKRMGYLTDVEKPRRWLGMFMTRKETVR